jgi:hypothetical protein
MRCVQCESDPDVVPGVSGETGDSGDCGTVFGLEGLKVGPGGEGGGLIICWGADFAALVPADVPEAAGAAFTARADEIMMLAPNTAAHPTTMIVRSILFVRIGLLPWAVGSIAPTDVERARRLTPQTPVLFRCRSSCRAHVARMPCSIVTH